MSSCLLFLILLATSHLNFKRMDDEELIKTDKNEVIKVDVALDTEYNDSFYISIQARFKFFLYINSKIMIFHLLFKIIQWNFF